MDDCACCGGDGDLPAEDVLSEPSLLYGYDEESINRFLSGVLTSAMVFLKMFTVSVYLVHHAAWTLSYNIYMKLRPRIVM